MCQELDYQANLEYSGDAGFLITNGEQITQQQPDEIEIPADRLAILDS